MSTCATRTLPVKLMPLDSGKLKLNPTGYKNVYMTLSSKYIAKVYVDHSYVNLGTYDTPEEANLIAIKWREENHGKFAN